MIIQPICIMDVDGTLAGRRKKHGKGYKGYVYVNDYYTWKFANYLKDNKHFDPEFLYKMGQAQKTYEKEKIELASLPHSKRWANVSGPYIKFSENLVTFFGQGIEDEEQDTIKQLGEKYIGTRNHKDEKFPFTDKLVDFLNSEGFLTLAISASPEDVVGPFCEDVGIQKTIATTYKVNFDGLYTGKVDKTYAGKCSKIEAVTKFLYDNDINEHSLRISLAFGNSPHDVFLNHVKQEHRFIIKTDGESGKVTEIFKGIVCEPSDDVVSIVKSQLEAK